MKSKLRPASAIIAALLLVFVVSVSAQSSTTSNGSGWGKGGNPKPSPSPTPVPSPSPAPNGDPNYTRTASNTSGTADQWSAGTNWDATPTSGSTAQLVFGGAVPASLAAGATIFTNNNIAGTFQLNRLDLTYSGPASGTQPTVTISGNPLQFVSNGATTPTLNLNGAGAVKPLLTISNNIVVTNNLSITGASDGVLSGVISSTGTITLAGSGVVTFSNATDSYSGQLTVQSGTLKIDNANNASQNGELGNSATSVILGGSGTTGTLEFTGPDDATSKKFTMATGGTGVFQVDTAATTLTLSGVVDGGGGLTKTGAGTLQLDAVNTYSGDTTINGGVLLLKNASGIPSGAGKGNVVIGSSGTLSTGDQNFSINGLSGSGVVQKTDGPGVLGNGNPDTMTIGNNNADGNFSGLIKDGGSGHELNIIKTGSGTQIFSGANTYAGTTAVNGGTLFANNTTGSATGTGAVTVSGAGTILGGTGFIGGTVTVNTGAILEGGTGSTGQTLTLSNNLTLNSGSIIELALGPSLTHSTLARTGGTWSFQSAQKFTFILNAGTTTGFYNNIITGLAADPTTESGWTITNSGFIGTFTYDGLGNIDLNVTAVPEPGTYVAAALACLTVAYTLRRRFIRRRVQA